MYILCQRPDAIGVARGLRDSCLSVAIRIPQLLLQFGVQVGLDMMAWTPARIWHMLKHMPGVCDEL